MQAASTVTQAASAVRRDHMSSAPQGQEPPQHESGPDLVNPVKAAVPGCTRTRYSVTFMPPLSARRHGHKQGTADEMDNATQKVPFGSQKRLRSWRRKVRQDRHG